MTDINGYVKARHDYLPYGEELPSNIGSRSSVGGYGAVDGVRQKFTGKQRDNESGLDYFGARYYGGAHGRFTTTDPNPVTKENFVNPQRWGLYVYVNNNPLRAVDPSGSDGEGKGGDKVISVFLQIAANNRNTVKNPRTGETTREPGPDWQQTSRDAKTNGYQLRLFGGNDVTGNSGPPSLASGDTFDNALRNSEVVLYIGHGYGPTGNGPFMPLAIEVGVDIYDSNGKQLARGGTDKKPDSNAAVVCNFSCNSATRSDYFNNTGKGFRTTVTMDSGQNGTTALGTLEKAAAAFVKAYAGARGNTQERALAGIKAAQSVLDKSRVPGDTGDTVKIYELRLHP